MDGCRRCVTTLDNRQSANGVVSHPVHRRLSIRGSIIPRYYSHLGLLLRTDCFFWRGGHAGLLPPTRFADVGSSLGGSSVRRYHGGRGFE